MKLSSYINSFTPKDIYRITKRSERLKKAQPYLFDFDYPIYDNPESVMSKEEIKNAIELGIMRFYYKRETGTSGGTIQDFKDELEEWLNRRMPYYNELFFTLTLKYDILDNTTLKETYSRTVEDELSEGITRKENINSNRDGTSNTNLDINSNETGKETKEDNSTNNFRGIELDTPQGSQNIDDMSFKHASGGSITKDTDIVSSELNTNKTGDQSQVGNNITTDKTNVASDLSNDKTQSKNKIESYTKERKGKIGIGSYPKLIADYRKNILTIIEDIIDEADILFYQLYDY